MRRILCLIGWHDWEPNRFNGKLFPLNGADPGALFDCRRCRKSKWRPSR